MSLYAALQCAVGGLTAQSSAIGNISDNLANAQTTGYKSVETRFESLVTQSNANVNDPGGVRASPYYLNGKQGNLVQVSSDTSLAISGAGFFPVRPAIVGADGTTTFGNTTYYTRAGDFSLNKSGYMVNGAGYYLTGYKVDENGVVDTSSSNPIQLSELLDNPVATSGVDYAANLPSSAELGYTASPSTIQIYDSLGGAHNLTVTWTKTGTSQWSAHVVVPNGVSDGGSPPTYSDYDVTMPFTFNDTTNIGTIESIGNANAAQAASYPLTNAMTLTANSTGPTGNNISYTVATGTTAGTHKITITNGTTTETVDNVNLGTGPYDWTAMVNAINALPSTLVTASVNGTGALDPGTLGLPLSHTLSGGANAEVYSVIDNSANPINKAQVRFNLSFDGAGSQAITVDFGTYNKSSGVTQFDDSTISVSTFDQNGIPRGSFQSLGIDSNGFVTLNYDNGRSRTIAQIPVVQFFAEGQLQRLSGGAFAQTLASGSARFSLAGTNGAGKLVSNSIESSNVDIADQFTKMIQAQQVYSANAKTITTSNSMMQEAINIIR